MFRCNFNHQFTSCPSCLNFPGKNSHRTQNKCSSISQFKSVLMFQIIHQANLMKRSLNITYPSSFSLAKRALQTRLSENPLSLSLSLVLEPQKVGNCAKLPVLRYYEATTTTRMTTTTTIIHSKLLSSNTSTFNFHSASASA